MAYFRSISGFTAQPRFACAAGVCQRPAVIDGFQALYVSDFTGWVTRGLFPFVLASEGLSRDS